MVTVSTSSGQSHGLLTVVTEVHPALRHRLEHALPTMVVVTVGQAGSSWSWATTTAADSSASTVRTAASLPMSCVSVRRVPWAFLQRLRLCLLRLFAVGGGTERKRRPASLALHLSPPHPPVGKMDSQFTLSCPHRTCFVSTAQPDLNIDAPLPAA